MTFDHHDLGHSDAYIAISSADDRGAVLTTLLHGAVDTEEIVPCAGGI